MSIQFNDSLTEKKIEKAVEKKLQQGNGAAAGAPTADAKALAKKKALAMLAVPRAVRAVARRRCVWLRMAAIGPHARPRRERAGA